MSSMWQRVPFRRSLSRVSKEEQSESKNPYCNLDDTASEEDILKFFILENGNDLQKLLVLACWSGDLSKVNEIPQPWKLNINESINTEGDTLLHLSMRRNKAVVVEFLLRKEEIDAFVTNKNSQSPIGIICQCRHCKHSTTESVKLYLKHILEKRTNPNFTKTVNEAVLHSQEMAEMVVTNCWEYVTSDNGNQKMSIIQQICCVKKIQSKNEETGNNGGVQLSEEYKYPLCDILKKYPTMVKAVLKKFDEKIHFSDSKYSNQQTAETEVMLDFCSLLPYQNEPGPCEASASPETELLMELIESSSSVHKAILKHPLVQSFLYLKWQRFRKFARFSIGFYVVLAMFMSMYVLNIQLGKCRIRPDLNRTQETNATTNSAKNRTIVELIQLLQNRPELMSHKQMEFCNIGVPTYFFLSVICLMLFLMLVVEIMELLIDDARWGYFLDVRNWLQWIYMGCAVVACIPVHVIKNDEFMYWQYQFAGFGLLTVWSLLLVQVSKVPGLAVYIDMLFRVIQNFIGCFMAFSCLITGFMLCNLVLFSNFEPTETIPRAILKTLAVIAGEFSYQEDFYRDAREYGILKNKHFLLYPASAHIFYILFIVVCSMALMNLLIGLAVAEVEAVRRDAEVNMLRRMTKEIYLMEKFIFNIIKFPACINKTLVKLISLNAMPELGKTSSCKLDPENAKSDHEKQKTNKTWIKIRPHCPKSTELPDELKFRAFLRARNNANFHKQKQEIVTSSEDEHDSYYPGSFKIASMKA